LSFVFGSALIFIYSTLPFVYYTPVWRTYNGEHLGRAASTGFLLSKSKSFYQVFIKLGEYVGGHNISTKFYNLPNLPRHPWIMALELSKNWISSICSPSRKSCSQKCCHYHWIYYKYDGRILCQFGPRVYFILPCQTCKPIRHKTYV